MVHTKRKLIDRVMAVISSFLMVIAMFPVSVTAQDDPNSQTTPYSLGGATMQLSQGTNGLVVTGNGTAEMTITMSEASLQWESAESASEKNEDGWWARVQITAPKGVSSDPRYQTVDGNDDFSNTQEDFAVKMDDGTHVTLWQKLTPEIIRNAIQNETDITKKYRFNWDGDEGKTFDQTIVFTIKPSTKIVLVEHKEKKYPELCNIAVTTSPENSNGSVLIDGSTTPSPVDKGSKAEVKITAADGYQILSAGIDDTTGALAGAAGKKEWTGTVIISKDTEIKVSFVKVYTVTVTSGENGEVTVLPNAASGSVTVTEGNDVTITASPETGYRVSDVKIDGESLSSFEPKNGTGYSTTFKPEKNQEYSFTFSPNIYNVAVNINTDITGETKVIDAPSSVEYNGNVIIALTDSNFSLSSFEVYKVIEENNQTTSQPMAVDFKYDNSGKAYVEIPNVSFDIKVEGKFKEKETVNEVQSSENPSQPSAGFFATVDALRTLENDGETIYVVKPNTYPKVSANGKYRLWLENEKTPVIVDSGDFVIQNDTIITGVDVFCQLNGESAKSWHKIGDFKTRRFVFDITSPSVSIKAEKEPVNEYYKEDIKLNVSVCDPEKNSGKEDWSGISKVTYQINGPEGSNLKPEKGTLYEKSDSEDYVHSMTFDNDNDKGITVDSKYFNMDGVNVTVTVTDAAGNSSSSNMNLNINSTVPKVSLDMDGKEDGALESYYSSSRNLEIVVEDREGTFSSGAIASGLSITKDSKPFTVSKEMIRWTQKNGSYVGTYSITEDGYYEISQSYTNLAGMAGEVSYAEGKNVQKFVIDTKTPFDLNVEYESDVSTKQFSGFNFSKDKVKVTVEAKDIVSGVNSFAYSCVPDSEHADANSGTGSKGTLPASRREDGTYYAEFEIPAQFRGNVSVTAIDKAGLSATLNPDGTTVVVDNIAPGIEVVFDDSKKVGDTSFYTGSRKATLKITEANFFSEDVSSNPESTEGKNGYLLVRKTFVDNDGKTSMTAVPASAFTKVDGVYQAPLTFEADGDYRLEVFYTDRSGNRSTYDSGKFTIDTTKPVVKVAFDSKNEIYDNGNQFRTDRKATITVTEHNFDAAMVDLTVKVNGTVDTEKTAYLHDSTKWKKVGNDYEIVIDLTEEGHYTFGISVKDKAGLVNQGVDYGTSTTPEEFTIDKTAPSELNITYNSSFIGKIMEFFGFYGNTVTVTLEAKDVTAGITGFTYSYTADTDHPSATTAGNTATYSYIEASAEQNSTIYKATFDIPAQFRGKVSFRAKDNAGNESELEDGKTIIVDTIAPGVKVSFDNSDAQNETYYKADRTAKITITEANFFEEDIVTDPNASNNVGMGQLLIRKTTVKGSNAAVVEAVKPAFTKNAEGKMVAEIPFNEDADYRLEIFYRDRSGNVAGSYDSGVFTVDKTSPVVIMDLGNGAYYDADRTVKLKVVEHNFDPSVLAFNISAKDTADTVIDLSSKDYQTYLKNKDNWNKVAEDTYEAELKYDIEGNYAVEVTYVDPAGNAQTAEVKDTFCVDKTEPEDLSITYHQTLIGRLLEVVTFNFYKAPVTVEMNAYDYYAGVAEFRFNCPVQDGASSVNTPSAGVIGAAHSEGTSLYHAEFTLPAQYRGNISFVAEDMAGNQKRFEDHEVTVIDDIAPEVNVSYDNNDEYHEGYYQEERNAEIKINEANFFPEADLRDRQLVIGVEKVTNDGTYSYEEVKPEFEKDQDLYTGYVNFSEDADYTFDISYTDRSGNVFDSYEKDSFTVDNIDPVIQVQYNDDEALYDNGNQFRTDRTAVITIVEHNFDAKEVNAVVTAFDKPVDSYTSYLKDDANWKHYAADGTLVDTAEEGDIHKAVITFSNEAHYTFAISCHDKAGRENQGVDYGTSAAPNVFTVDKSAPTNLDIRIDDESVLGSMSTVSFDTFYDHAVTLKLSADFTISGMQSMQYQKVADVQEYNENGEWTAYNSETGITVVPSEKFILYFRAQDRAGNVSIVRTTGIVVDNQKPIGEKNAPEIDILPMDTNENGMYNSNVTVDLKVVDPKYAGSTASDKGHYSGLNLITYRIYTTDTAAVETGTLMNLAESTTGAVFDKDHLVSSWNGQIVIDAAKFNSNNTIVEVTATDNAGNIRTTATTAGQIRIDVTAPVIDVTYDNNDADSGKYFKADRTATIVVTERNFNPDDVVLTLTNTEKTVPALSGWRKVNGTGNLDDTKWISTLHYAADGDYVFDIEYTDPSGWKCTKDQVNYGNETAPREFTIDKTTPVISVTYDNNAALNGNYYKDARTATIEITEHNLDPNGADRDRISITMTATDDGAATAVPAVSAWTTDGDRHTAVISYSSDALYTFDIAMRDKAGNESADFEEQTFYVDRTMPTLEINGVADRSANNGDVIPVISYSDTNYDENQVSITLTGANRKAVELDGSYADAHNGRVFTFNNFPEEKEMDDIYTLHATLTDKAGNTTEKTVVFSVNRFGSTYALSEESSRLNGTYVKKANDVIVYETNVDELSNIVITLFKDGTSRELKEGTDYRINLEGGNGEWYHYTYTVLAKNFAEDGLYSLTVESDDAAGNVAKNDQDTKNTAINFGVDATLPIINVENLESNKTYAVDNMTVTMNVKDNLKLTGVSVELDGKTVQSWNSTELETIIRNGGNFSFDIAGDSTDAHTLVVYAKDAAGNGEKVSATELPANAEKIENFYVTTNLWVRFYTNKPLFFGTVGGSVLLIALIIFLLL